MLQISNLSSYKFAALLAISCVFFGNFKSTQLSCDSLKNGKFYFYPKNSNKEYLLIRQDSVQKEIDLNTGDTSFWKLHWIDNCSLTSKYFQGPATGNLELFLKRHITILQILDIRESFYIFKASLDSLSSTFTAIDTIWLKRK